MNLIWKKNRLPVYLHGKTSLKLLEDWLGHLDSEHKNACSGGHENYNLGRPFMVITAMHLVWTMPGSREEDFKEIHNFLLITP